MKRHCGSRSPFGSSDVSVAHSSPPSFLARVAGESRSVRTACPPPSEWSLNGRISSSQDDGALRHWCFAPEQLQVPALHSASDRSSNSPELWPLCASHPPSHTRPLRRTHSLCAYPNIPHPRLSGVTAAEACPG
ncbi:hypothetical protein K456DRAFT_1459435 [Colletotrichum gloeosporioides 23]|nr:hypothetical protein K456DRAFT_1459435 [Colletotrichum gloeosporioides 23]